MISAPTSHDGPLMCLSPSHRVGRRWTRSIWLTCSRSDSQCCSLARSSSGDATSTQPEQHFKSVTMQPWFTLLPFMLLRRVPGQSYVRKDELHARFDKFVDGQWGDLQDEARQSTTVKVSRSPLADSVERRAEAAEQKVMLGEVSRARPVPHRGSIGTGN